MILCDVLVMCTGDRPFIRQTASVFNSTDCSRVLVQTPHYDHQCMPRPLAPVHHCYRSMHSANYDI